MADNSGVRQVLGGALRHVGDLAASWGRRLDGTQAPLVIARSGYLYAGGGIDHEQPGPPHLGHLYAEFQIPARLACPYPVVMIHGGAQTGTNFIGTPDGREGWAQRFLRRGWAVYVVDAVARGRSPHWAQDLSPTTVPFRQIVQDLFTAPARSRRWPQAHLHTRFPGTGEPGDPVFDALYATQFPGGGDHIGQQRLNTEAGVALLDRIGPAVLLTHSQSAPIGWGIADRRPGLVKGILAIEPNGPPMHDIQHLGAPDWFAEVPHEKPWALADVPLTYEPPIPEGGHLDVVRDEVPDPDLVDCWIQREPARRLANLAEIPVLAVTAEASYHASYDHGTVAWLRQAGVDVTWIRLADQGLHGNGHMMMIESNSDAIADVLLEWLDTRIRP